jgi:hypothetical protein
MQNRTAAAVSTWYRDASALPAPLDHAYQDMPPPSRDELRPSFAKNDLPST